MGCLFHPSDALSFEKENYLFNPFSCQVCKDWKYENGGSVGSSGGGGMVFLHVLI